MRAYDWSPRVVAELTVPLVGSKVDRIAQSKTDSVVTLPLRVNQMRMVRNDHNHADELELSAEWEDAGIDPRLLGSASVRLWIGDAGDRNDWQPTDENLRFAGVLTKVGRVAKEEGFSVSLRALDYTQLFLENKPYHPDGAPDYSMTLSQLWTHVCDYTGPLLEDGTISSTVSSLRDRLVFIGGASDRTIGDAVSARFHDGAIPYDPNHDSWAVWQQCVGMLGLISFIYLDTCIVTTATDYYSAKNPPVLVWGKNLASLTEQRNVGFGGKGVAVQSFDTLTGTTIEALYPPQGDDRVKKKWATSKVSKKPAKHPPAEQRDYFPIPNVTNQAVLEDIAKRIWEERSRQELEGTAVTYEMALETEDGSARDLLTLGAGEVIRVQFDQAHLASIAQMSDLGARIAYLQAQGYSYDVALLLSTNLAEVARLDATFFTRSVAVTLEATEDGGNFEVEIQFINRIQIGGDAKAV